MSEGARRGGEQQGAPFPKKKIRRRKKWRKAGGANPVGSNHLLPGSSQHAMLQHPTPQSKAPKHGQQSQWKRKRDTYQRIPVRKDTVSHKTVGRRRHGKMDEKGQYSHAPPPRRHSPRQNYGGKRRQTQGQQTQKQNQGGHYQRPSVVVRKGKAVSHEHPRREQKLREAEKTLSKQPNSEQQLPSSKVELSAKEKQKLKKKKKKAKLATARHASAVKLARQLHSDALSAMAGDSKLLCVDIEAWERCNKFITEIGVSTATVSRGRLCSVRATHFIIKENARRRNGRFVADNRDNFIFGSSRWVSLSDAKRSLVQLLPSSTHVIGHALGGDLAWLSAKGVVVEKPSFDTQAIAPALNGGVTEGLSLKKLCVSHCDFSPTYLHNGGNDAFYTLLVFLRMCQVDTDSCAEFNRLNSR